MKAWQPQPWAEHAACKDTPKHHFFLDRGDERYNGYTYTRAICDRCPVRAECLEHALTWPEKYGFWGGCSEKEREAIRRQRRREPA